MSAPAALHARQGAGFGSAVGYAVAALVGVAFAAQIFPLDALDGTITLLHPVVGDPAQHIIGQRYFLADAWRWPPLLTRLIEPPEGVNIAMTDSIPLVALAAKPFAGVLPHGAHFIYGWVALCYVLQPLAAVFALRCAGVRGTAVVVAGGVMAVCMPAFIFRFGHAALCGHFTLLLALGLYFRMVDDPQPAVFRLRLWLVSLALLIVALLIHPYLMAMTAGILWAAPLSLLARRQALPAVRLALQLAGSLVVLGGVMAAAGYLGADVAQGFGYYSLNLLEPVVPTGSALIGGFALPDATGGQAEGYSYLGLGLAALAVVGAAQLRQAALRRWLLGHAGLLAVAVGAAAFAVSDRVYLGHHLLFHLNVVPQALRQFRASGRFVWVDLYALLVLGSALTWMGLGRRVGAVVLLALALLQAVDTQSLRGEVAGQVSRANPWAVEPALYRPLLAGHRRLTVWPTAECHEDLVTDAVFMHILLLASEIALPVNTVPTARVTGATDGCGSLALTRGLLPGELRLLLPGVSPNVVAALPGMQGRCHRLPEGVVACTQGDSLDSQPIVAAARFPLGQALSLGGPDGAALAGLGWTQADADGAWTIGPRATLLGGIPPGAGPLRLTVVAHGLAPAGQAQIVHVQADGKDVATWAVGQDADRTYVADLPANPDGEVAIMFTISQPVRPQDVLGNGDPRPLGLFLRSFTLAPA